MTLPLPPEDAAARPGTPGSAPPPPAGPDPTSEEFATGGSGGAFGFPTTGGETPNAPGDKQVWNVGGQYYLVWFVPNTDPPIPLLYEVEDNNLSPFFAPGSAPTPRTVGLSSVQRAGGLFRGTTNLLNNPDQHPFEGMLANWEAEIRIRPWLADPEMLAIISVAALEGRDPSDAEIQGTEWWRTHSQAERDWLTLWYGDPETARQRQEDQRIQVAEALQRSGIANASPEIVNFIADAVTRGEWSPVFAEQQIRGLADPAAGIELDSGLAALTGEGLDTTRGEVNRVRSLARQYLGPLFGNWDAAQLDEWAGILRNDPDGEVRLVDFLLQEQQRLAGQYSDAQRQWLELQDANPLGAEQALNDQRLAVRDAFIASGVNNAPQELINLIADNVTTGVWTPDYGQEQIRQVADPAMEGRADREVRQMLAGLREGGLQLDTTTAMEDVVRDMAMRWLGPRFGGNWTDRTVAEWAGRLRQDPDAMQGFEEFLQQQFDGKFMAYAGQQLNYEAIAGPERGVWAATWGELPDETSGLWNRVLQLNDPHEAERLLRRVGVQQGNEQVAADLRAGARAAFNADLVSPSV